MKNAAEMVGRDRRARRNRATTDSSAIRPYQ